jgi:hypothetical protein
MNTTFEQMDRFVFDSIGQITASNQYEYLRRHGYQDWLDYESDPKNLNFVFLNNDYHLDSQQDMVRLYELFKVLSRAEYKKQVRGIDIVCIYPEGGRDTHEHYGISPWDEDGLEVLEGIIFSHTGFKVS